MAACFITRAPRVAACVLALLLAACGGGGGGGDDDGAGGPPAITVVDGGDVSSADGKVTLSVPADSASADADGTLTAATPTPEMLADPHYVAGSAYRWNGPALSFRTPATWVFSPAGAASAAAGRRFAQGSFADFVSPANLCNASYLEANNLEPQAITLLGNSCPAGCAKVAQAAPLMGGFGPQPRSVCVPVLDAKLVEAPGTCTGLTQVANDEEPYATILAEAEQASGKDYTICKPKPIQASPWLGSGSLADEPAIGCLPGVRAVQCGLFTIDRNGVRGVFEDTTPPTSALLAADNVPAKPFLKPIPGQDEWHVYVAAGASQAVPLVVNVNALQESIGLRQVELREIVVSPGTSTSGPSISQLVRWSVVPVGGSLPSGVKTYNSKVAGTDVSFGYAAAQLATRRFFVRAYDWHGNAKDSPTITFKRMLPPAPVINSFVATPSVVQPPGGAVTLSWNVSGAAGVAIDQGLGAAPAIGSRVVDVTANTQYTLTATSNLGVVSTLPVAVTVAADTTGPTVSLASNATSVTAPASLTLTATATDAVGVTQVQFFRGGTTLLGTDSTPGNGFTQVVNLTNADAGAIGFTARAVDAAGNFTTSSAVVVTVGVDTVPPTVSLASNASTVLAPGSATLTATANDNIGVTKVEFRRGSTLIGTDTTPGDGWKQTVSFVEADAGTASFSARAFDAMDNQTNSSAVTITVTLPSTNDRYASPTGSDTSATCAQAAPCLTIAKAAQLAGSTGTAWLMDGSYTSATQGSAGVALPAGTTLRAANAGVPVLKVPLLPAGNAVVEGLRFGAGGGVTASGGTIALSGIDFVEHRIAAPIVLSGTAALTLDAGGVANYIAGAVPPTPNRGTGPLAQLSGNAVMTVNGGSFDGAEGMGDTGIAFPPPVVQVQDNAQFTLNDVVMKVRSIPVAFAVRGAAKLTLAGSTVQRIGVPGAAVQGIFVEAAIGTPAQVTLNDTLVTGYQFGGNSAALRVGATGSATVAASGATLQLSSLGLWVENGGSAALTLTDSIVQNNLFGGIRCDGACSLAMSGGQVKGNGASGATGFSFYGGLAFLGGGPYAVSLRNVQVIDNRNTVTTGSPAVDTNSGITMVGNAASTWDLGTAASPGGNTFTGNTTSAQTTGVNVKVAAGVTVNAVGNTFIVNTQGADSAGQYQLGTAPCGPSACVLTTGTGSNYRVTSGALRLAQ